MGWKNKSKEFVSEYNREYHKKNRDRLRARPERKHTRRAYRFRFLYGLNQEKFDALVVAQGGRCAICQCPCEAKRRHEEKDGKKMFRVDHDHATGEVRGLLCHGCNVGLGGFRDSESSLIAAAEYLAAHRRTKLKLA